MSMSKAQAESIVRAMSIKDLEDAVVKSGLKRKDARNNLSVKGIQGLVVKHLEYHAMLGKKS